MQANPETSGNSGEFARLGALRGERGNQTVVVPMPSIILVACGIVVLTLVRVIAAGAAPLAFDEAYYWLWSKHLAAGYSDHPPMVAATIRLGTLIAGDTQLGVRLIGVLLALPASWAVWRSAQLLFKNERLALTSAVLFNLTLAVAIGTVIATPDAPLIAASAFVLLFLAKLTDSNDGRWWLAVGAAVGVALLSKLSALFFGISILAWLLIVPELRRWFFSPWPWLGGLIAFAVFSPFILWNANHDWVSFATQFGRIGFNRLTLHYIGEYLATQIGYATPPVFILGAMGLAAFAKGRGGPVGARVLLGAIVWPLAIYLAWHSLHDRVEGNWTSSLFPAFCLAAAAAVHTVEWHGYWRKLRDWSNWLAIPVGVGLALFIYLQAIFALIPLGSIDPTAQKLGAGWRQLGLQIDAIRLQIGANTVLTTNYALAGWLAFYLPSHPTVVQVNERYRYSYEPAPQPGIFQGTLLYVGDPTNDLAALIKQRYSMFREIASLERERKGIAIEAYTLFQVSGLIGNPLDNTRFRETMAAPSEPRHQAAP
jgi:4-amino-4-deoxy-L-arabinose transferase-like glycosyltransferase